ncbi:MAG: energy transducer TonB [bacterium]
MKLNLVFSFSLHIVFLAALFLSRARQPKFEGYPTVVPVELVHIKPVAFTAPEAKTVQPAQKPRISVPKKLEGVTLEKKPVQKKKKPEEPVKPEITKKTQAEQVGVKSESIRLDVKEFPFTYYLALLKSRIQSYWEPPFQSSGHTLSKKAIVFFKIARSGNITNMAVEKGSGDFLFDRAALRAVTLANPLPPLPYDFPEPALGVHFEFEQGH